jgi:tetratricopeptide (TPR) repeat protein
VVRCHRAFLHWQRDVSSAPPFVRRAVARVPGDEELLTLAGGVHEFLASPRVQNSDWAESVRERGLPLRKPHEYLVQAERSYEEVLRSSPSLTEVRVHLGRVLGELNRLDEAAVELTEATRNAGSNEMHYLAWLFLGDTQAALHRAAEAEAAYSRAIALFPAAPSAHTALSLYARQRGDHRLAHEALALQTAARTNDTDPWDDYFDVGVTKQAEALLDALRRRLTVAENVQ